jgi:hypothetical protein
MAYLKNQWHSNPLSEKQSASAALYTPHLVRFAQSQQV